MKQIKWIFTIIVLSTASNIFAAERFQSGKIYDITSTGDGLLIRLEGNMVPTKCPNYKGRGWMLIPEQNKTMISVALEHFMHGKKEATVHTFGTLGIYCKVNQYDPHN